MTTSTARPRSYEFVLLALLVLFWGCIGLNRVGIGFIFPDHRARVPHAALAGRAADLRHLHQLGVQQLDRRMAVRQPRAGRAILLPAVAFTALATAAMGATWNFLSMFVVRDLLGLGDGIGWSVGQATISEEAAPHRRGFNQALYNAGYSFFGVGLGALIVTSLTAHLGWRWVFPIIGLRHRGGVRRAVRGDAGADRPPAHTPQDRLAHGVRAAADPLGVLLVTLMGCATLAWLQLSIGYNVLFLTKVRGSAWSRPAPSCRPGACRHGGQCCCRWPRIIWGRRPVILVSALLCAAPRPPMPSAVSTSRDAAAAGGERVLRLRPCPSSSPPASARAPAEWRGAALGMTNFFAVIMGTAVMPVVGGIVADHFGLAAALWLPVGAQIVLAGWCWRSPRPRRGWWRDAARPGRGRPPSRPPGSNRLQRLPHFDVAFGGPDPGIGDAADLVEAARDVEGEAVVEDHPLP